MRRIMSLVGMVVLAIAACGGCEKKPDTLVLPRYREDDRTVEVRIRQPDFWAITPDGVYYKRTTGNVTIYHTPKGGTSFVYER